MKTSNSVVFQPKYASFLILLKIEQGAIKIVLNKTKKAEFFPWGYPGGKEEEIDKSNFLRTAVRESDEETSLDIGLCLDKKIKLGEISRRNDNPNLPHFINYFHLVFLKGNQIPVITDKKESIIEVGWFNLRQAEQMELKIQHRIILIELWYVLNDLASTDPNIAKAVYGFNFEKFVRPSENFWKLKVKPEYSELIGYFLPKHTYRMLTQNK